ncbi:hypothetical protein GLOIN_2v1875532 [Rhizophagus clarus]|uniref:Uncharacterized protein n=1 Tax=Rhizophagus clarus TaxID=94130 RepID=A0A8H3LRC6_9GLOM|nr:hypothetical protein GLOIN_2v1875532 [Rhizophagus clarus]
MNWKISNLKQDLEKKWSRITASNYTKFFILVSIAQALVLIFLQFRMLERNGNKFLTMYNLNKSNETERIDDECYNEQFLSLYVLTLENLMFIFFYFFQLYFCFNAIFHRNTIQIITIASINLAFIFIGIMQLFEVGNTRNDLQNHCPNLGFYPQSDKDIGGDVKIQKLYKTRLIFIMLLKLDALMIILFSGLLVPVFYILYKEKDGVTTPLMITSTIIMILVFFFEILAYHSLNNEWGVGMLIFIVFWILASFNFAGLCVVVFNLSLETRWYIGFIMGIFCFLFSLSTLIYSLIVYKNFGKGLKHLKKRRAEDSHDDKRDLISKPRMIKRDPSDPKFETKDTEKFVIDI